MGLKLIPIKSYYAYFQIKLIKLTENGMISV